MLKDFSRKPFYKKALWVLGALVVLVILFDKIILPWYVSSPETSVPSVIGDNIDQAIEKLNDADLDPVVSDTTYDEKFPEGTVILQNPGAGDIVKNGRRIYLFVSGGEPVVFVPQLRGKSVRDAKFSLERVGLKLGYSEEMPSNNPKGVIFDQQFAEGTKLKKGESVGVSISTGVESEEGIMVPDLVGKSLSEAQRTIIDSSLSVGKINYQRSFSLLPNTVLDQYPSSGNKVKRGSAVDLFVTTSADGQNDNEIIEE